MILSDACEDYHGLFEVVWTLNTRFPDVSETVKRQVAELALGDLLNRGLVSLYTTTWPGTIYVPVAAHLARSAISDPASWAPPPEAPGKYYCFAATPEGEQAHGHGQFKVL